MVLVVTGCLGFIGSHFVRQMLRLKHKVYGVDSKTYAHNANVLQEFEYYNNFHFICEDINNLEHLSDCDYVVNFAAETHVGNSIIDSKTFIHTNVDGVRNLLTLIRKKPENIREKPVFVQISTDEVLGDTQTDKLSEEACLNPSNPYAASKAAAELLIRSFGRTYEIKYRIIRPTNNYGTHQHYEKFIPLCVRLLQENRKIRLHNFGTPIRNWIHVEDTCRAIQTVINGGKNGEVYHIGGSEEKTNLSVAVKIVELYENRMIDVDDYKDYFDFSHHRPGQDMRYAINDEKLRGLGWEPSEKFDQTIGQIVDFYRLNWRW